MRKRAWACTYTYAFSAYKYWTNSSAFCLNWNCEIRLLLVLAEMQRRRHALSLIPSLERKTYIMLDLITLPTLPQLLMLGGAVQPACHITLSLTRPLFTLHTSQNIPKTPTAPHSAHHLPHPPGPLYFEWNSHPCPRPHWYVKVKAWGTCVLPEGRRPFDLQPIKASTGRTQGTQAFEAYIP